jgi:hypothetical protein
MIARDAEPIFNDGPYKRIDIGAVPVRPCIDEPESPYVSASEAERIWQLVVQSSEGCGLPPPSPSGEVID